MKDLIDFLASNSANLGVIILSITCGLLCLQIRDLHKRIDWLWDFITGDINE